MKHRILPLLPFLAAALLVRFQFLLEMDVLLPLEGLYVDEVTFFGTPFVEGIEGFSRPPGMFVAATLLGAAGSVTAARVLMSVLSLVPALVLFLAFGCRNRWGRTFSVAMAFSPFLLLFGTQLMPAVPAAVLVSLSLYAALRNEYLLSGFAAGAAMLFRAELAMVPLVLLPLSTGERFRLWGRFAGGSAAAVLPVVVLNLLAGAGPVIAANGGENLWLGTDWGLISTPPGTEFEELVSTGDSPGTGDRVFLGRALDAVSSDPLRWTGMGISKVAAFLSLPGPGRNFETGWIMKSTFLFALLPLTLAAMSLGTGCSFGGGEEEYWKRISVSVVMTGVLAAFVFFPSARFRTAVIPAFWFLASGCTGSTRRRLLGGAAPAALIVLLSLFHTYPGMERPGLTAVLAAQHELSTGNLGASFEYLDDAVSRGFRGADLHNIRGALLSLSGRRVEGLGEFRRALESAPESPTIWKNLAVSLWSNGLYRESVEAARNAVHLNPLLREELAPILVREEDLR
ncbi:MAG: hypothetical protein AVO35_04120 [Candidatus Aegiribacteria sp. MLS_C]|nr:MAG: hypothetical protein AVO35_04120 [Candidatus Aegiribacteria sp. MLS_C]